MKQIYTIGILLLLWGCAPATQQSVKSESSPSSSSMSALCSSGKECHNKGLNYVGRGEAASYKVARGYFYKSCYYGWSEGCNNLAFLYANGRGGKQSYTEAYKYWNMACDMGNQLGCTNLQLAKDKVAAMHKGK